MQKDNDFDLLIGRYSFEVNEMCKKIFFGISPLYKDNVPIDNYNQIVLSSLFTQLYRTGENILLLTSNGNAFEADVLVRILSEGTVKYIYMMQGELKERSSLIEEYYEIIPEMQKLSDHERAEEAMQIFREFGYEKHPFQLSILSDADLDRLKSKYSKTAISNMNKKWSFKKLLEELVSKDEKYYVLYTTLYSYSLSSHYIHYDGEALHMRAEALKEQVQRQDNSLEVAHILRVVSNILALMLLRVGEYVRQYKNSDEKVLSSIAEAMELQVEIDDIIEKIIKEKY